MGWFESWGSCYKFSRALGCCWLPLVFYPGSNTWSSGHMLQIISHTNTTRGVMISLTHVVRSTYVCSLNSITGFRVFVPKMFRTRFIRVRNSSDYMCWLKVNWVNNPICSTLKNWMAHRGQAIMQAASDSALALYGLYRGEIFAPLSQIHLINICPHSSVFVFSLEWESLSSDNCLVSRRLIQCQAPNENCYFPATTKLYFIPKIENRH